MIRIGQIKLDPDHTKADLVQKIAKTLRIAEKEILHYEIKKQSIDARKKPQVKYIYTVDVKVNNEQKVLRSKKEIKLYLQMKFYINFHKLEK